MDFCKTNLINTTGVITLDSNTILASNIYNPDTNYQYYSDGFNDDLTATSITITFDATTPVSRIALIGHNLKKFSAFYNGSTANSITLSSGDTSTLSYVTNSETSQVFRFATLAVSSVTIDMNTTQVADEEKVFGFLYMGDLYFSFGRIPSSGNYKPSRKAKQVVHNMGDGGTKIHNIAQKWSHDIKISYLTTDQRDQLKTIYDLNDSFYFSPFPTSAGWDGILYNANWVGDYDLDRYSDNAVDAGFSSTMKLREV